MKYQLSILCLLILHSTRSFSQADIEHEVIDRVRMKYHLSAGASISKMLSNRKDFQEILERKFGYVIQGGISQYLGPKIDLSFFVGFSNKGNIHRARSLDSNNPPNTIESIDKDILNYMILNIPFTYYLDKKCRVGISAGSYLGALISDRQHSEQYVNGVLSTSFTNRNVLGYKKFDIGISTELSYRISLLNSAPALVGLRWDRGLFNISPGSAAIYNQIFALQIGVIL